MAEADHVQRHPRCASSTFRGVVLGGLITLVFTAANVYLGLKIGLTFATAIPGRGDLDGAAALLSGTTPSSRTTSCRPSRPPAGTLSSIIFVLPGLIMIGWWQGFPYWTTVAVCVIGGTLGVMYSVPLRRALVTGSDLPYPEGVAAAEALKVGAEVRGGRRGQQEGPAGHRGGLGGLRRVLAAGRAEGAQQ